MATTRPTHPNIAVSEDPTDANIRIDLLVIYPVLAALAVLAVWSDCRLRPRE
jgi:hypothetical protein